MKCKICGTRKARRYCRGVSGDICSVCCGTEREVSIDCPSTCPYLVEARHHEKLQPINPGQLSNADVQITEEFLREHEYLLLFLGATLLGASLETVGTVDSDIREALESLIRTYRTLESGLLYESRPNNMVAAAVQQKVQDEIQKMRKHMSEQGSTSIRDVEILAILVFLERIALHHHNGRPRGRVFMDYLRAFFPMDKPNVTASPSLIQV